MFKELRLKKANMLKLPLQAVCWVKTLQGPRTHCYHFPSQIFQYFTVKGFTSLLQSVRDEATDIKESYIADYMADEISLSFVIPDLFCTVHGHTLCSIDKTYVCLFYIIIMHLNIETLLNAFRSALSGQSNWKSDSVMIQNISICLLMQFKMSVVKHSECD